MFLPLKFEDGAFAAAPRLEPDAAALPLNDAVHDCQSHATTLDLIAGLERLKHLENTLRILGRYALAVVLDREDILVTLLMAGDDHTALWPRVLLYRIADETLARFTDGVLHESPYRGDGAQLLHLRDYNPLDSSKRIHWKASAKTEKFFVKEFQRDQGRDLTLYFDCYPGGNTVSEIQEKAISVVASIGYKATEKGYKATFCFPDATFEIGAGGQSVITSLLDYLAGIKTTPPDGVYRNPVNKDSVVLVVRSKSIPSTAKLDHLQMRVTLVDDFPMQDRLKTL